uniref:Uncharacterized protein n=1 Tax=Fundulus heteroclitus TaxID=8078 RepID=A0A3Q2QEG6_FUNHE
RNSHPAVVMRKRALDRERSRTRVNIGQASSEWRELKEKEGLTLEGFPSLCVHVKCFPQEFA